MSTNSGQRTVNFENIPDELTRLRQWVLWKALPNKDCSKKPRKVPNQPNRKQAKVNEPDTWSTFAEVKAAFEAGGYAGIGFVFSADDPYVGIDLDNCFNPKTGEIAPWAAEVIKRFQDCYREFSPSGTGVHIIGRGELPIAGTGKKSGDHEMYQYGRYFCFTGDQIGECKGVPVCSPRFVEQFREWWPEAGKGNGKPQKPPQPAPPTGSFIMRPDVNGVERCRNYLAKMPDAISGQGGHDRTFAAACVCFNFGLSDSEAIEIMRWFNTTKCDEQWTEQELLHKLADAEDRVKRDGEFGKFCKEDDRPLALGQVEAGPEKNEGERPKEPARLKVIESRELASTDFHRDFLVKDILVENQPAVIGGRSKTLKTSLLVDLTVSLGSGTPFLGQFDSATTIVCMLSGESGDFTIQETAKRIAESKGIDLREVTAFWGFDLPQIGIRRGLNQLDRLIRENGIKVLVIDPAYLCLLSGVKNASAANVFDIGPLLSDLASVGKDNEATIVLCHHFRKNSPSDRFSIPELEELAMAGFVEFARQWILVGRRSEYELDGNHELWMNAGGSAGHQGRWAVNIDEGLIGDDFSGRKWDVEVVSVDNARREQKRQAELQKAKQVEEQEESWKRSVWQALEAYPEGETEKQIRTKARLNPDRASLGLMLLQQEGRVEACTVLKNNHQYAGFKLTENGSQP